MKQLFQQPKRATHQRIIIQAQRLHRIANQQSGANASDKSFCKISGRLPLQHSGLLLLLAFPERLAKRRDHHGNYLTAYGKGVVLSETDALVDNNYIVAVQFFQRKQTLAVALAAEVSVEQALAWKIVKLETKTQLEFDQKNNRINSASQTNHWRYR